MTRVGAETRDGLHLPGSLSSLHAVLGTRTPQGVITWVEADPGASPLEALDQRLSWAGGAVATGLVPGFDAGTDLKGFRRAWLL